jgi:hypothetical protein
VTVDTFFALMGASFQIIFALVVIGIFEELWRVW